MPACGSEAACINGLCSSGKSSLASPQCLASPLPPRRSRARAAHPHHLHASGARGAPPRTGITCFALLRTVYKVLVYSVLAPAIWLSGWIWLFWLCVRAPVKLLQIFLGLLQRLVPIGRSNRRTGCCVLISGGSTVQSVRLARNLTQAGARVVVCELQGLFGLARFSRACASYYSVPAPGAAGAAAYVSALKSIVRRERVDTFIPVSAANPAYFDGLARPHLEMLGCECLVPGAAEIAQLDDPLELLRRTRLLGLPTPWHRLLGNLSEAASLYEQGPLRARHLAMPAGPAGLAERPPELLLPATLAEFVRSRRQRADGPACWLVVREPGGAHYVTCTTVRESRLVANVTCRVDEARAALVPERRPEVERWLETFFAGGFTARISGHLSFRLAAAEDRPGELVPIGCRVGIGLAYLGLDGRYASLLLKGSFSATETRSRAQLGASTQFGRLLDRGEALFLYWDPLPYCVYRYLQLPFRRIAELWGAQHKPPLAVVQ